MFVTVDLEIFYTLCRYGYELSPYQISHGSLLP